MRLRTIVKQKTMTFGESNIIAVIDDGCTSGLATPSDHTKGLRRGELEAQPFVIIRTGQQKGQQKGQLKNVTEEQSHLRTQTLICDVLALSPYIVAH